MLLFGLLLAGCQSVTPSHRGQDETVIKAVRFLQREVPAWQRDNGCYSCHNNGDAARALYLAGQSGYKVSSAALADTTRWLKTPQQWAKNKGDPGFSDQRLANLQFALALQKSSAGKEGEMSAALQLLTQDQAKDGSWPIDAGSTVGSPATYGTPLATCLALQVLKASRTAKAEAARERALDWLRKARVVTTLDAAAVLLAAKDFPAAFSKEKLTQCRTRLTTAQANDGGWGPYADAPTEVFDTALALLALSSDGAGEQAELIQRGRAYLKVQQLADGSWPATTRPSGGNSYAQMMSTTGWATLALLATERLD